MQNGNNLVDIAGNGYLITSGIGAHKLHIRKLPWYEARKICIREGGEFLIAIILDDGSSKCSVTFLSFSVNNNTSS